MEAREGARPGYRDVNRTVGARKEEVPLELRDGGGKQWTMETGGKRSHKHAWTSSCWPLS